MQRMYLIALLCMLPLPTQAQEDAALAAAKDVVHNLADQKFVYVWDNLTSQWQKDHATKDAVLAYFSQSRPMLGTLGTQILVWQTHTTHDANTGYDGDIYSFTFKDNYSAGDFFETVVVTKDNDGKYRMGNLIIAPVPKQ